MSTSVLLRVDANADVGLGHLTRCLGFARALDESGLAPVFAMRSSVYADMALHAGHQLNVRPLWMPTRLVQTADEAGAAAIVLDIHGLEEDDVRALRGAGVPLIGLSVVGAGVGLLDAVVNPAADIVQPHPSNPDMTLLAGPEGVLVDMQRVRPPASQRTPGLVTVAIGGGAGQEAELADVVAGLRDVAAATQVHVFVGRAFKERESLEEALDQQQAHLHIGDPSLPEYIAQSEVIVCGYGTTLFEAAAMGTPAVVVPLSPLHERLARHMSDYGILSLLSRSTNLKEHVATQVQQILMDETAQDHAEQWRQRFLQAQAPHRATQLVHVLIKPC